MVKILSSSLSKLPDWSTVGYADFPNYHEILPFHLRMRLLFFHALGILMRVRITVDGEPYGFSPHRPLVREFFFPRPWVDAE